MNDTILIVPWVVACFGFFCLGGLWQARKVLAWRIRWIKVEHDLARLENRKPRDISEVECERP